MVSISWTEEAICICRLLKAFSSIGDVLQFQLKLGAILCSLNRHSSLFVVPHGHWQSFQVARLANLKIKAAITFKEALQVQTDSADQLLIVIHRSVIPEHDLSNFLLKLQDKHKGMLSHCLENGIISKYLWSVLKAPIDEPNNTKPEYYVTISALSRSRIAV